MTIFYLLYVAVFIAGWVLGAFIAGWVWERASQLKRDTLQAHTTWIVQQAARYERNKLHKKM